MTEFEDLCASDLMVTDLVTIEPQRSLAEAARCMTDRSVRCLLVPPERAALSLGILTNKDIVQILARSSPGLLQDLTVADAMTRPVVSVQREMNLVECINLMRMTGVRRVPVLERTQLVGLLSYSDVLRYVATTPQQ